MLSVSAIGVNWPLLTIAGTTAGKLSDIRANNTVAVTSTLGSHLARRTCAKRSGSQIMAINIPPTNVAELCSQTNSRPGFTAAWTPSNIPIVSMEQASHNL